MKKYILLFMVASFSLLQGCKQENTAQKESESTVLQYDIDVSDFVAFNLAPFGLNAIISLPSASSSPSIKYEMDGFEWNIIGENDFSITIEDWGQENGIERSKEKIMKDKHFEILTIEASDSIFAYQRKNIEMNLMTFHIMRQQKIDGINYIFRTKEEGVIDEEDFAKLAASVKSVVVASIANAMENP